MLTERHDTWVYINDDFELLSDGRVLWGSDRDGWWRLYLYDAAGKAARAVSPEGIVVAKLDRVVESTGTIFFTGFRSDGLGAKDRQFYRVPLEGGESTLLSTEAAGTATARRGGGRQVVGVDAQHRERSAARDCLPRGPEGGRGAAVRGRHRLRPRGATQVGVPDRSGPRRGGTPGAHAQAARVRPDVAGIRC